MSEKEVPSLPDVVNTVKSSPPAHCTKDHVCRICLRKHYISKCGSTVVKSVQVPPGRSRYSYMNCLADTEVRDMCSIGRCRRINSAAIHVQAVWTSYAQQICNLLQYLQASSGLLCPDMCMKEEKMCSSFCPCHPSKKCLFCTDTSDGCIETYDALLCKRRRFPCVFTTWKL